MADKSGWTCDERNRDQCCNAHGCHCREITDLLARLEAHTPGPARTEGTSVMVKRIFHKEYLMRVGEIPGLCVVASDLISAGWLIEAGFAWAEDDREGPVIYLTKGGRKIFEAATRQDRPAGKEK